MSQVSVIIPAYNGAAFLAQAIESALNQQYPTIEIIIVNDGSTDATAAIGQQYAEQYPNITYIEQPNQGASAAKNTGIAAAKGDFINFLDQDDYYIYPDFFAQAVALLQQNPQVGSIHSGWHQVDEKGNLIARELPYETIPELDAKAWVAHTPIRLNAMLFRRDYVSLGFREDFAHAEDVEFVMRLIWEKQIKFLWFPMATVAYRAHSQSATHSDTYSYIESNIQAWELMLDYPQCPPEVKINKNRYLYYKIFWGIRSLLEAPQPNYEMITHYLKMSKQYSPYHPRQTPLHWVMQFRLYAKPPQFAALIPCVEAASGRHTWFGIDSHTFLAWYFEVGWWYAYAHEQLPTETAPATPPINDRFWQVSLYSQPGLFYNHGLPVEALLAQMPAAYLPTLHLIAAYCAVQSGQYWQSLSFAAKGFTPKAFWQLFRLLTITSTEMKTE